MEGSCGMEHLDFLSDFVGDFHLQGLLPPNPDCPIFGCWPEVCPFARATSSTYPRSGWRPVPASYIPGILGGRSPFTTPLPLTPVCVGGRGNAPGRDVGLRLGRHRGK